MAFRPLTDEDMQNVYDYGQTVLPEEKGLFDRITDDVVDTVSNYFKGAEQGWNEWQRADKNNNEVNPVTDAEYLGIGDTIEPTQEQVDAQQWNDQAASNFMHQTVEPVVMPAAIVAKGALGLAAAPFMADSAIDSYNKGGIGQVGRDLTYGGIEDVWDKRNDPEFLQQLHDRPVSTLSSVAMAAVPPILMGKGAYKGAKIGKEYLDKTVSDTVDNALNDMELGHLSPDAVTNRDIAPPVESTQPLMNALEQIKQQKFDDVENIYNDRAEQQANLTDARQGLVNALDRVNGQKYDNVENIYNDRATQQSDLTNARQGLVNALDRVNGQKFDDATQQSYWDFMKRQQEDANNLQAQKNDIAGSVLMNPADRMEVGADIPTKTRIGDPYIFDKQEPQNIMLPNQREPQNLILPQQRQQRQQPVQPGFMRTAENIADERGKKQLMDQLVQATKNKDFWNAANIAEQMGNTQLAKVLRNTVKKNDPREFITSDDITIKNNYAKLNAGDRLIADLFEYHNKQSKVTVPEILTELQNERQRLIDQHSQYLKSQLDMQKPVKYSKESLSGDFFSRQASTKFQFSKEYAQSKGKKSWSQLSKKDQNDMLKQEAVSQLRNGHTDPLYGEIIPQKYADDFNNLEASINGLKEIQPKIEKATSKALWTHEPSGAGRNQSLYDAANDTKNIIGSLRQEQVGGKLYSGFDPTGGKYDKVKLSSLLDNKINNIADRMWNTEDTSIPKTKNWINEKRQTTPKSPTDYVINKFDKLYQSAIDDKHPLSKVDNELYKQARVANAAAYGQATELLTRKDADSFRNILEPIKSQTKEFSQYLEAVHSIDQQAAELKTRMTPEEAQGTVNSASPQFRQAQKQIVSYNNKLLNILVDGDVLTRDAVNAMRQKWPNYVPFMRDFSDTAAVDNFIRSKGFINVANPIKKLKGSEREVIDPLESIIKNTYIFTNIAERNKIGLTFSKLADLPGDEGVVVRLEGQHAQDPNTSTFTVWENGKKQAYRTTPELYRAMASLDKEASNFITDMLAVPAGWLRAGATLTPDFMARNLTRDAVSAFINSNGNFIPVVDTFRGLSHALKKDDLYWDWLSNGGGMSTLVSLDRVGLQAKLKDFRTKTGMEKLVTAINPKTYLEMLRTLSEYSELGTRLGVYGKDINKGMNQLDAIIDSREASVDFGRAGTKGRPLNRVIAFLNANLQDTDKLIRNLKNPATRGRTMSKITMSLVIPSIATWYMGKDDERVQRLPSWQRDLFWIVPTKMSGPGWDGLIRIPKPFGPGVLFASGTERMLDWAYKNKKDAFKGYGGSMWNAFAPGIVPTAAVPLMEWWANKSMFTGQDIVPRREQGLPDKLQFGPHTTELSKYIGGKLNVSPRKIDNTIYGYTGGLGRQVSDFGNFIMGGGKNQPATPVTQMPILRGFTATSYNNSQPVQDYYDKLKENSQKIAEYKFNNQRPDMNTQKNHDTFNKSTKVMQSLLKAERDIQTSNKLTPDQKRQKLDALQLNQVKAAEAILKKIR